MVEAAVEFTDEVLLGDLDVLEEQFGGVGGVLADLVELAAAGEPSIPSSIISRLMPLCLADGSVLTAVSTSLDSRPLLMKVFWPLTTQ